MRLRRVDVENLISRSDDLPTVPVKGSDATRTPYLSPLLFPQRAPGSRKSGAAIPADWHFSLVQNLISRRNTDFIPITIAPIFPSTQAARASQERKGRSG